jgi:hypothetical protein
MPQGVHQFNQVYTHLRNHIFCHKYLTMPTIMPADALIKAVDNLVNAILDHLPKNSVAADAVKQLMEIYKIQADQATCEARAQRVLREQALAQSVAKEQQAVEPVQSNHQHTSTAFPSFEVEDNQANDPQAASGPPVISQDEDSPPAANTRQQWQTGMLMQDNMFHMMEVPGYKAPFTPAQAAACKYPLQFLCDFAYAILDKDIGNLLEYRHFIKRPKYKNTWSQSFGKEIR